MDKGVKMARRRKGEKFCIVCGDPVPAGKDRYCSRGCYEQSYKIEKPPRVCDICGSPVKDGRAKYCDAPACREEQHRRDLERRNKRNRARRQYAQKEHPILEGGMKPIDPYFLSRGDPSMLRVGSVMEAGMVS